MWPFSRWNRVGARHAVPLRVFGPPAIGLAVLLACATGSALARERPRRGRRGIDKSPAVGEMAPDFELVTLKWLLMSDKERAGAKAKSEAEAKRRDAERGEDRTDKDRAGLRSQAARRNGAGSPISQGLQKSAELPSAEPLLTQPTGDGKTKTEDVKMGHVRLSSFRGKAPVVFVLASYT